MILKLLDPFSSLILESVVLRHDESISVVEAVSPKTIMAHYTRGGRVVLPIMSLELWHGK